MKRWISLAAAVLALAATPAVASASGESDSVHFGPINSGSADSGTCGNNWANDTYKRVFEASTSANPDGTFSATERFIGGHFETLAGPSPDACDPSGTPGSTVAGGIDGSFHGNFLIVVTGGSFNPAADCDPTSCGTTAGFVATVYGATATYTVPSFGFTYHAHGPDLVQSEWRNASADQGGNGGDIRST